MKDDADSTEQQLFLQDLSVYRSVTWALAREWGQRGMILKKEAFYSVLLEMWLESKLPTFKVLGLVGILVFWQNLCSGYITIEEKLNIDVGSAWKGSLFG